MVLSFFNVSVFMAATSIVRCPADQSIVFNLSHRGGLIGGAATRSLSDSRIRRIFVTRAGDMFQHCPAGMFQPFRSIFVSRFQKGQATLISLFFNLVGIKDSLLGATENVVQWQAFSAPSGHKQVIVPYKGSASQRLSRWS